MGLPKYVNTGEKRIEGSFGWSVQLKHVVKVKVADLEMKEANMFVVASEEMTMMSPVIFVDICIVLEAMIVNSHNIPSCPYK